LFLAQNFYVDVKDKDNVRHFKILHDQQLKE